jgi:hypothetical protein
MKNVVTVKENIKTEVIKGRANESFPLRWKLFKKLITENRLGPLTLYKPQNHKECDKTVSLILERTKE